jgi:putative ABC transport system permease protein
LLTESVLLALVGGVLGVALGYVGLRALVALMSDVLPRANGVALDATVLTVTAGVTVAAGIAFGLWPAWQLSHDNTAEAVRTGARETGRNATVRTALVVTEVALAVVVLAGAGLLTRSLSNLRDVRPGFEPANLITFNLSLPAALYRTTPDRFTYFNRAVEQLRAIPGVNAVALSTTLPVAGRGTGAWFNILDRPLPPDQTPPAVPYRVVTPDYFATVGIALRQGRLLQDTDTVDGMRAVLISEAVARRFWPDGNALGQRIYLGAPNNRLFDDAEIVGIVADVKQSGLDESVSEAVYIPYRMMRASSSFWVAVRTSVTPESIIPLARTALRRIDPSIPMNRVRLMSDVVDASLAPTRSSVYLLGIFAVLAFALAIVGVFAVLSYTMDQRRGEMAIRLALGASATRVMRQMLGQGLRQVVIGLLAGLLACVLLARSIESLLFNVQPTDPLTLSTVAVALLMVATAAVYVPCRRALRVDPWTVLRQS